jgi:dihydrofolate reductase
MDDQRGIGLNNGLPWKLPEDMLHFKTTTLHHPIIMGRKTFESIGRPLPKRKNMVVSRNPNWGHEGCFLQGSIEEAVENADDSDIFIIGGAEIFKQALPLADKLIVTHIHKTYECDTFFPEIDPLCWAPSGVTTRLHSLTAGVDYTIATYISKSKEAL